MQFGSKPNQAPLRAAFETQTTPNHLHASVPLIQPAILVFGGGIGCAGTEFAQWQVKPGGLFLQKSQAGLQILWAGWVRGSTPTGQVDRRTKHAMRLTGMFIKKHIPKGMPAIEILPGCFATMGGLSVGIVRKRGRQSNFVRVLGGFGRGPCRKDPQKESGG